MWGEGEGVLKTFILVRNEKYLQGQTLHRFSAMAKTSQDTKFLLLINHLWEDRTFVIETTTMSKYAVYFYVSTIESIHKTHQLSMFSVNDKKH